MNYPALSEPRLFFKPASWLAVPALLPLLLLSAQASAQQFQSTGADFSPVNSNGMSGTGSVLINAHDDGPNIDYTNVRVSAYAFVADPEDPNFTQDPGFNTVAGGLPAGRTLSIGVLDSLKYWDCAGAVKLGAPVGGEALEFNFGAASRYLTGTSGPLSPIPLGAVTANGSIHKHLNAFLMTDSPGHTRDFVAHTPGVYVAALQANVTGLTSSEPIFAVYSYNATQAQVDRAKFQIRNTLAPGSTILKNVTSLIGLSALPGEANLATGGQVTITSNNGVFTSEVDDLTADARRGSVVLNSAGSEGPLFALLYLSGAAPDVADLIGKLDVPEAYDIAPATAAPSDPLYGQIQRLRAAYPDFSALVKFQKPDARGAFTWDFAANPEVVLNAIAAVPGLLGDYNGDGRVDAADYTVWADSFNGTGASLPADGNGDGVVNAADYTVWADHFGQGAGSPGAPGAPGSPVPEPVCAAPLAVAFSALLRRCRRVS